MTRKPTPRALRWLWLLLLPLPAMAGYAGSGDPLGTITEISNRAAKGDRLPTAQTAGVEWTSCGPAGRSSTDRRCAALTGAD